MPINPDAVGAKDHGLAEAAAMSLPCASKITALVTLPPLSIPRKKEVTMDSETRLAESYQAPHTVARDT